MKKTLSVADVAAQIGCNPSTVNRIARTHGIGGRVGRVRVFSQKQANEVASHYHGGPGCPLFGDPEFSRRAGAARKGYRKNKE